MVDGLPTSAAEVEQALGQLVASSMVELLHDAQGRRRYRLHGNPITLTLKP